MYTHIVMMEFAKDADQTFFDKVGMFSQRIRAECHGVIAYDFGLNEAARSGGYTHAVVSVFSDAAAHDDYQISPVHVDMKTYMGPFIQRIVVFDGAIPGNAVFA